MDFTEYVYSVLIVSSAEKINQAIRELLPENRYHPLTFVSDAGSAGRQILEHRFDIVVINTPLPDDIGVRLAIDICNGSGTGVLLLVKNEHYAEINDQVSQFGVLTLSKPTTAVMIQQSLQLLCGTRERLRRMEQKTTSLEDKMAEIKIVNRAKLILIEQLKMTEAEAHRFIEKQAMDRCVSRRTIADTIISTYK
ncbi:MAG TPA: ANTAR domain-containing protein [Bacillota bacterium]|nr:ANTAR domain-containing protein [Bacillota bacterium]